MSNKIVWLESASLDIPGASKFYADLFGWPFCDGREDELHHDRL